MNGTYYLVIPTTRNGWMPATKWRIVEGEIDSDENAIIVPLASKQEGKQVVAYHKRYGSNYLETAPRHRDPLPAIMARAWA